MRRESLRRYVKFPFATPLPRGAGISIRERSATRRIGCRRLLPQLCPLRESQQPNHHDFDAVDLHRAVLEDFLDDATHLGLVLGPAIVLLLTRYVAGQKRPVVLHFCFYPNSGAHFRNAFSWVSGPTAATEPIPTKDRPFSSDAHGGRYAGLRVYGVSRFSGGSL